MNTTIVTPAEPVIDLARAKLHCKLSGTARDVEVTDAIATAQAWAQKELQVALGIQTLAFSFDEWLGSAVVPYDVTTVVSVTDASGPVAYTRIGRRFACEASAPITITIGCGLTGINVPAPVKSAMLLVVGDLIENPQSQVEVELYENKALESLLAMERRRLPI